MKILLNAVHSYDVKYKLLDYFSIIAPHVLLNILKLSLMLNLPLFFKLMMPDFLSAVLRYWEANRKWDEALQLMPSDEKIYEMKAQVGFVHSLV